MNDVLLDISVSKNDIIIILSSLRRWEAINKLSKNEIRENIELFETYRTRIEKLEKRKKLEEENARHMEYKKNG